jgi:RHS repeat-associated protein
VLLEWSTISNNKFTGYERDAAAGIDYAQARHYKFGRGRFMQPDPSGLQTHRLREPQNLNRYRFVRNDPVNFVDRNGLEDEWWVEGDFSVTISGGGNGGPIDMSGLYGFGTNGPNGPGMLLDTGHEGSGGTGYVDLPMFEIIPLGDQSALLKEILNDTCKGFIKGLIDDVESATGDTAYSNDISKIIGAINNPTTGNGISLVPSYTTSTGLSAGGAAIGSHHNGTAQIVLVSVQRNFTGMTSGQVAFDTRVNQQYYAHAILHEAIHLSAAVGTYSDMELVDVLRARGLINNDDYGKINPTNADGSASKAWDDVLKQHCHF